MVKVSKVSNNISYNEFSKNLIHALLNSYITITFHASTKNYGQQKRCSEKTEHLFKF